MSEIVIYERVGSVDRRIVMTQDERDPTKWRHGTVRLLTTLREGKNARFPACCRWRFALEELITNGQSEQALKRGVRLTRDSSPYVPCAVLHTRHLTHAAWEQRQR